MKTGIVATPDMDTQSQTIMQQATRMLLYGFVESKQLDDFLFVFQKQIIPACLPPRNDQQTAFQHLLLIIAVVCVFIVEMERSYQSPLGCILSKDISQKVMIRGMTDMKPRIFVGETHGNSLPSMFPTPGINMSILQDIISHTTFVVNKYHSSPFLFLMVSRSSKLTRPVSSS